MFLLFNWGREALLRSFQETREQGAGSREEGKKGRREEGKKGRREEDLTKVYDLRSGWCAASGGALEKLEMKTGWLNPLI